MCVSCKTNFVCRDWSNNNLREVQAGAFTGLENSLRTVDLSDNVLPSFPALTDLRQLSSLDLSNNDIQYLEFEAFKLAPELTSLYVCLLALIYQANS